MRCHRFIIVAVLLAMPGAVLAQSNPFDGLKRGGSPYSDPALYAEHKAQWLARVEARPQDVDVLEGAAGFFVIQDPALAQDLLERASAIEPTNPRWLEKLAQLHRLHASSGDVTEAILALSLIERAYAMDTAGRRYLLTDLPAMAFDAGDTGKAREYADRLLEEAKGRRNDWDYGNAVHKGNLILGRIAVREGRLAAARAFLRAAGETPGSPQLDSFGPNMSLAKDLLERGETEAVLAYFELCRVFWKMGGSRLDAWSQEVQGGTIPRFGPNLVY